MDKKIYPIKPSWHNIELFPMKPNSISMEFYLIKLDAGKKLCPIRPG